MRKISFTLCSVFLVVTSSVFTSGCETGEVKKEEETKGKWTQKADIPGDLRQGAFSFSVAGKGYLGLGQYSGNLHRDLWEYNPDADAWSPKTPFPGTPMAEGGVFVVNQKAYLVAGVIRYATSAQPVRDVWEYDPANDSWMQKNKFSGAGGVAAGFNAGNTGTL